MDVVPRNPFSLELALVIALPLLAIVGGAYAASLAYTQGFTPITEPAAQVQPAR